MRAEWLADHPELHTSVALAAQRGVRLVWRGSMNQLPSTEEANHYACSLLHLEPQDALILMRAAVDQPVPQRLALLEGQMYEEIHSQTLARRCLEHYHASAIAGWPTDDVLHRVRGARVLHPTHEHVLRLMKAVDADQSLETFEEILSEDPLLAYRFMLYANSAALGARNPINSLRRALVMLGYGTLKEWLATQLTHASHDKDLQPIRLSDRDARATDLAPAGCRREPGAAQRGLPVRPVSRLNDVLDEPLETDAHAPAAVRAHPRCSRAAAKAPMPPACSWPMRWSAKTAPPPSAQCAKSTISSLEHVNRTLLRLACEWHNQRPHW